MNIFDRNILILGIPGFLALFSANFVSDIPTIRDSQLPFVYFVLSVLSLSVPLGVSFIIAKIRKKIFVLDVLIRNTYFLSSTLVLSIVVGFLFGVLHTTDAISESLRSVFGKDVVQIYSHNELVRELFSRAYRDDFPDGRLGFLPSSKFKHANLYVKISLNDGSVIYEGVVNKFFSGTDQPQAYLSPACEYSQAEMKIVQGPGVWINLTEATDIQFIDSRCSSCSTLHEKLRGRDGGKSCPYLD